MNYYEHHLGDYLRDTAHLSMLEDGAYRRLLDAYYIKEQPIPGDLRDAYRLARAKNKAERIAVDEVLREFFVRDEQGWRHKRCDDEIAKFRDAEPDREARRENERERQRRARERRKALFDKLREYGEIPAWDTATSELLSRLSRVTATSPDTPVTPPVTRNDTRDDTATHPHSPLPIPIPIPNPEDTRRAQPDNERPAEHPADQRVSMAGAVCIALKAEGIGACNPGHPDLDVLLQQGAEVQNFVSAARAAVGKGKGFAYVLGVVKGQLADARRLAAASRGPPAAVNGHSGSAARAARMAEAVPSLARKKQPEADDFIDTEASDVTPRRLG